MKKLLISGCLISLITCTCLNGCASIPANSDMDATPIPETQAIEEMSVNEGENVETSAEALSATDEIDAEADASLLNFVDVYGEHYQTEILEEVRKHDYDWTCLNTDESYPTYEDVAYTSRMGIDVSEYQGDIDWEEVAQAGISFAFVRIGYRGYGDTGALCPDATALENISAAQAAGLDVGCYFFSQAINEEEAREEAEFVLAQLGDTQLQLPVVYDPERIRDDVARTDDVTGDQFTRNTLAFSQIVSDAGYDVMIYSNMVWEAFEYDLLQLEQLELWYADYEPLPQTPYHFRFWQYSENGQVPGIEGIVDLNLEFCKKQK